MSSRHNLNFSLLVRVQSWWTSTEDSPQPKVDLLPHSEKHRAIYAFLVGDPQQEAVSLEIVLTETGPSC